MNANPRSSRQVLPRYTTPVILTLLTLLIAGVLLTSAGCASATSPPGTIASSAPQPTDEQVIEAYGKLPLSFVPNQGQVADEQVRYHAQGAGFGFFFTPTGAMLSFVGEKAPNSGEAADATEEEEPTAARGFALALDFVEANPEAKLEAREELAGKVNYLRGSDPAEHQTDLPTYRELIYQDLWPGVDVVVRGEEGALKYEFLVEPGARVEDIGLAYRGADGLSLDEEGNLQISTALGELTDLAPVSYQEVDGERVPLESRYVLDEGAGSYGFEVGAGYDPARPLVIDPALLPGDLAYSTYLGGFGSVVSLDGPGDDGEGIAVDANGRAYVTGDTPSLDYPTTPGAFDETHNGSTDAFVTKLKPNGSALLYSTILGGTNADEGQGIAVDANGRAHVTGYTGSADDFPTTNGAFDTTFNGGLDAFVTKLKPNGSALLYSTILGGTNAEEGQGIAGIAVRSGNAYVTGTTLSENYPTTNGAFDTTFNGGTFDAFVTKLKENGSGLLYSTYLGGAGSDTAEDIAVDGNGRAYVTGGASGGYPITAGAFDTTHGGSRDAFVSKLNPAGSTLAYSTYLGRTSFDSGAGIAVDGSGRAYVTGTTFSTGYPTTNGAFDTTFNGNSDFYSDAFVTKLSPAGSAVAYSTFLGGTNTDVGGDIAVYPSSNAAYVTGTTYSSGYPTTNGAFDTTFGGSGDAFVTKLPTSGGLCALPCS